MVGYNARDDKTQAEGRLIATELNEFLDLMHVDPKIVYTCEDKQIFGLRID